MTNQRKLCLKSVSDCNDVCSRQEKWGEMMSFVERYGGAAVPGRAVTTNDRWRTWQTSIRETLITEKKKEHFASNGAVTRVVKRSFKTSIKVYNFDSTISHNEGDGSSGKRLLVDCEGWLTYRVLRWAFSSYFSGGGNRSGENRAKSLFWLSSSFQCVV